MRNAQTTIGQNAKNNGTRIVSARQITSGDRLYHPMLIQGMQVRRVMTCGDGSLRIVTDLGEQRMTGSIQVRVLH